jgi:hypothetical protein
MRHFSLPAAAFLLIAGYNCHAATTRTVNNNTNPNGANTSTACVAAAYTSISAALTASHAGDILNVCPGIYPEALDITIPVTVKGIQDGNSYAIVLIPTAGISTTDLYDSSAVNATVLVDDVGNVTLDHLIVDGSQDSADLLSENCGIDNVGVYFRNSSGTLSNSEVRNTGLRGGGVLTGCQEGLGVYMESGDARFVNVKLTGNSIHDYDKDGVDSYGLGSNCLTATGNVVTGSGPTMITAQNGIEVDTGSATLDGNTVSDNNYVVPQGGTAYGATNILVFTNGFKAENNTSTDSNGDFYIDGSYATVTYNAMSKSVNGDHVDLIGDHNVVEHNVMTHADVNGVYICGSKNAVHDNTINDAAYGIYEDQTSSCVPASSYSVTAGVTAASNSATGNTLFNVTTLYTPDNNTFPHLTPAVTAAPHSRLHVSPFRKK